MYNYFHLAGIQIQRHTLFQDIGDFYDYVYDVQTIRINPQHILIGFMNLNDVELKIVSVLRTYMR